jgi:hypothetical protein
MMRHRVLNKWTLYYGRINRTESDLFRKIKPHGTPEVTHCAMENMKKVGKDKGRRKENYKQSVPFNMVPTSQEIKGTLCDHRCLHDDISSRKKRRGEDLDTLEREGTWGS